MANQTYQVKKSDTWATIAQKAFGNAAADVALMKANPGISLLRQGISINVPQAQASAPGGAPPIQQTFGYGGYGGGGGGGYQPYGPSFSYYGGYIPRYVPRYTPTLTRAPTPPAATAYAGSPSYLQSWFQRGAGYYRPPYTAPQTPRPGEQQRPVARPTPTPSPMPYTPLNFPVWVPPQASMTANQWSGIPYRQPVPAPTPRPGGTSTPQATGGTQYPPGAFMPGNWPYLPGQAYLTPDQYTGIPPEPKIGVFAYEEDEGGGGGGWGGWGGWGGGGGGKQTYAPRQSIPGASNAWSLGQTPTGRQMNLDNASLGYIHWRIF